MPVHVRPAYASCVQSPYVATFHESSTELSRPTAPEKKGSRHNPQRNADRSAGPYPASLLSQSMKQWGQSQASINGRLLGLLGPYHQYVIGTFNTCSRGPTERSLTDTCGCYNFGGAALPHTYSPTFLTSCPHFPLVAPPGLQFNQVLTTKPKCCVLKNLWPPRGLSTTRQSTVTYI
jgi:hypothetical protein